MRKILCSIALFMILLESHGQANRDSLIHELRTSRTDTNKVILLLSIGDAFQNSSPDTARLYIRAALNLSKTLGYEKGIQKAYRRIAYTHVIQSHYDSLRYYSELGLQLARQNRDTFNIGVSLFNLGIAYRFMSDYENAVVNNLEGARLLEGKGYTNIESALYDGLQVLYMTLAQYDKAIVYGEKACAAGRLMEDKNALAVALNNLSLSYMEADQLDNAKKVLNEALVVSRRMENMSVEGAALNNLAEIAIRQNEIDLVKGYSERGLQLHQALNALEGVAISSRGLAIYYLHKGNFEKASELATAALKITKDNALLLETSQSLKVLSSVAFAKKEFAAGQKYLLESQQLDAKIFSESLAEKETAMKVKYETQKKEMKIQELEAERKVAQLAVSRQNIINYLIIVAALTVVVVSLLSFRNYKQKQKLQQQRISELEIERQLSATEAVLKGEEAERTRMAKDLHDGLGGMLSGIKYSFNTMKGNLIMTPENQLAFERSMDMLDSSIMEMRRVAHNMMPEALLKFGLDTALKDYCHDIERSGALRVTYQSIGLENVNIEQTVSITVYRIVQELLTNVMKHSGSSTALVQVTKTGDQLSMTVEDDGKGFDPSILERSKGIGWTNISHRVEFLKGKLDVKSEKDNGTSVQIEFKI